MTGYGRLLELNLRSLRATGGQLGQETAKRVAASKASPRLRVEASRSGGTEEPTAILTGPNGELFLHSRYRPRSEAVKFAAGLEGCDYLVLFGFGLGYEAEAIIQTAPQMQLRIIEPDPSLLYSAFLERDLSKLLGLAQVRIICEEQVDEAVGRLDYLPFFFPRFRSTHLRARSTADDQYFRECAARLEVLVGAAGGDYRACANYGLRWCINTIRNLTLLERSYSLTESVPTKRWNIVGAGPSADRTIGDLARATDSFTLYCDTAVRTAAAAGTERLTAVTIDPQPISKLHYLGVMPEQVHLVSDIGAHHSLLQSFPYLYFISSGHPLHRYLSSRGLPVGPTLVQGGSVSETALRLAHHAGAEEIAVHGLDFAYLAERSYVVGSWLESYLRNKSDRLHSMSNQNYSFIRQRKAERRSTAPEERSATGDRQNPPTYNSSLLDDYRAAFFSAATELGYHYQPGASWSSAGLLSTEHPGSKPFGTTTGTTTTTMAHGVKDVLLRLRQELLELHLPTTETSFTMSYRFLGDAGMTLVPAAIYFHERRGSDRCEAMRQSCELLQDQISELIDADT